LAKLMVKKYPDDILYRHIRAEAYAKNGKWSKAIVLFDHVVFTDKFNQRLRYDSEISHRAFCSDCFRPIRGIRQKCQSTTCVDYDHCTDCLNRSGGSSESCLQHPRISIPSSLSVMRAYPQVPSPPPVQLPNSSSAPRPHTHLSPNPAQIPAPEISPEPVNPSAQNSPTTASARATMAQPTMLPGPRVIADVRRRGQHYSVRF
jgi:hypothetical protein